MRRRDLSLWDRKRGSGIPVIFLRIGIGILRGIFGVILLRSRIRLLRCRRSFEFVQELWLTEKRTGRKLAVRKRGDAICSRSMRTRGRCTMAPSLRSRTSWDPGNVVESEAPVVSRGWAAHDDRWLMRD
ncbi:hypothetical protein HII31_09783 [Pseudocercospora fuligena]|uniref:Uncharacterized protein n=1 Tax=Pseudocercospora fuligena TaxID=685502 RepID=A0A8H6VEY3_9PEZI|nr:hypothetical protein HII31_09783 [Pseudocercospora fuligena]